MQTILVASDAPTLRREVEAVISGPGVEVQTVTSGPEVVSFVTDESPDLVIVDMQMGNMGGMAVEPRTPAPGVLRRRWTTSPC